MDTSPFQNSHYGGKSATIRKGKIVTFSKVSIEFHVKVWFQFQCCKGMYALSS